MVKYYAYDGAVSTNEAMDGVAGLEITEEQYSDAINGMMEGKIVTIIEGVMVVADPPPPPEPPPEPPGEEH